MTSVRTPSLERRHSHALLTALTLVNVVMQLTSALLLKLAPPATSENLLWVGIILCGVLFLNVVRFIVWGALHKRFPVSLAYPASALFIPGILIMAWWFDEPVGAKQVVGAILVLFGVMLLLSKSDA